MQALLCASPGIYVANFLLLKVCKTIYVARSPFSEMFLGLFLSKNDDALASSFALLQNLVLKNARIVSVELDVA